MGKQLQQPRQIRIIIPEIKIGSAGAAAIHVLGISVMLCFSNT
jgi:hypothetical protein